MKRLERIQSYDKEQLAKVLCSIIETAFDNYENESKVVVRFCDYCPVTEMCHKDHPGFIDWLEEEI